MSKIIVKDKEITITGFSDDDYVSLTDIAKFLNNDDPRYPIQNWMRLKDT
ncbi:MAG: KilA-N domain-containing protein, partial [Bacilli bacterium]|nr:KilA-N domain-containing protein [Mollicutes bacterium]MDY3899273.1 KilA-N domain-containing protein [Bacilli bacterium]